MTKTVSLICFLILVCAALTSCGSKSSTGTQHVPSGIKFRAFVSNPLWPNSISAAPALNIVDASKDLLSIFTVNLAGVVGNVGPMALSPDRTFTIVASPTESSIEVVDNFRETGQSRVTLPGLTRSMFVWIDNKTAYAAVPTAPVTAAQGQSSGAVVVLNLPNSVVSATIPVAGAQYVIDSHNGSRILALGSDPQAVTIINPTQLGSSNDPRTVVTSSFFDHPVWGLFTADDTVAYILNCGAECGGSAASVAVLDLTQSSPQVTASIPVPAATYGLLNGAILYVGGSSTSGGTMSTISISSNTVTNPPVAITDGYHDRMSLTANGQIFIGARSCSGACLSIFNIATSKVTIPATTGDVTGIQPITGRSAVYVCQNGVLNIYDTTSGALQKTQIDIVGQAVDVELVDTP